MNPLKAYFQLFTNPKEFYQTYFDQPKQVLYLAYAITAILLLPAVFLGLFLEASSLLASTLWFFAAILLLALAVPINIGLSGLFYHLAVLVLGGRGITKSLTIFGASALIAIPYLFINLVAELALTELTAFLVSAPVIIAGFIHVVYAEVQGLKTHYDFGTGRSLVVSLVYPLLLTFILFLAFIVLATIGLIALGMA